MCGGTANELGIPQGLSPRVRGNPCPILEVRAEGLSPRVRGNHSLRLSEGYPGLSPRVRGNQLELTRQGAGGRSIPACAGEPEGGSPGLSQGLSPRVRGNLTVEDERRTRSIPACAGEPLVNVIEHALLYSYLEYY